MRRRRPKDVRARRRSAVRPTRRPPPARDGGVMVELIRENPVAALVVACEIAFWVFLAAAVALAASPR